MVQGALTLHSRRESAPWAGPVGPRRSRSQPAGRHPAGREGHRMTSERSLERPLDRPWAGHAVVTGASSGIGLAIAARLLREGWQVTGLSRSAPALDHPGFTHRAVDLLDGAALAAALAGCAPTPLGHAAGLVRSGMLGALGPRAGGEALGPA